MDIFIHSVTLTCAAGCVFHNSLAFKLVHDVIGVCMCVVDVCVCVCVYVWCGVCVCVFHRCVYVHLGGADAAAASSDCSPTPHVLQVRLDISYQLLANIKRVGNIFAVVMAFADFCL